MNPILAKIVIFLGLAFVSLGCGKTIRQSATEQLLTSDAVDQAIAGIDFRVLEGKTVYLDTGYIKTIKGIGFVNADYIISSLRQQIVAANCLLQDRRDDAEFVVEARVGALGTDSHDLSYGLPASNALNSASSLVPTLPTIPTIPEISVARKQQQQAAAKIGVFAYNRKTLEPVWQSGVRRGNSKSRELWVFGAGPFQSGDIYKSPRLAGSSLSLGNANDKNIVSRPDVNYRSEYRFAEMDDEVEDEIQQAGHAVVEDQKTESKKETPKGTTKKPAKSSTAKAKPPRKAEHSNATKLKKGA